MSERPSIAIIGTGNVGASLGATLAKAGYELRFGVRPGSDISSVLEQLRSSGATVSAMSPQEAARAASLVFLAVPAAAAIEAVAALGELGDAILVDCTNPVRWDGGPVWAPPAEGSVTQAIARAFPQARVVKAFNGFGAEFHANPSLPGIESGVTVFIVGDDVEAKQQVASVAEAAGFAPVDAGPLRNAGVLENAAVLWIHLATVGGLGREVALQLLRR